MSHIPFHLAFPVLDLEATRAFYCDVLGCSVGRSSETWIDFNFFGHQISAHLSKNRSTSFVNPVDSKEIPVPHFGAVLGWEHFMLLAEKLQEKSVFFIHEPMIRFEGKVGEQATMFLRDPSGNAIEFKSFKDPTLLFAT